MEISVINQTAFRPGIARIQTVVQTVMKSLYPLCKEVSVVLVTRSEMKKINALHRGKNNVTDGLAFSYEEEKTGEVILCPEYISQEADAIGISRRELFETVLVHALVHIAGYDHKSNSETSNMEAAEKKMHLKLAKQK